MENPLVTPVIGGFFTRFPPECAFFVEKLDEDRAIFALWISPVSYQQPVENCGGKAFFCTGVDKWAVL